MDFSVHSCHCIDWSLGFRQPCMVPSPHTLRPSLPPSLPLSLPVCAQTHGFPKVMGVMSHLDGLKNNKALGKTKKRLKQRFWTEIYQVVSEGARDGGREGGSE